MIVHVQYAAFRFDSGLGTEGNIMDMGELAEFAMGAHKRVHEPGECTDSYGDGWCDGIAHWRMNPYILDVMDMEEWEWLCDGRHQGLCMDI